MDTFDDIKKEIENIEENIKAEIIVKEIMEATDTSFNNLTIKNSGAYQRALSGDFLSISKLESHTKQSLLKLSLSRNGLYDKLPEGLFHQDIQENFSYSEIKQKQKEEERASRLFFAPIEDELFLHRTHLYAKEETIFNEFENLGDDFLIDLWKIDKDIPKEYAVEFIKLLPQASKIVGNLELTFKYLGQILKTEVTYLKSFRTQEIAKLPQVSSNEGRLGVDFTLHQAYTEEEQPFIEITIIPSSKQRIKDFIGKNSLRRVIDVFVSYFLPLDYEFSVEISYPSPSNFVMEENIGCYMGIDTIL